ncbi:MAG: DUF3352 domain-containing protein [Cyanobacteria bacterium J06638_28]
MLQADRLMTLAAIASTLVMSLPAIAQVDPEPPIIPEVATVLPDNLAYVMLLDMRNETWQQLEQYSFFQVLQEQGNEAPNPGGLPLLPLDLDYRTDIEPWVGDTVGLALLPLEDSSSMLSVESESLQIMEQMLLLAPIAQADEFTGFMDTVQALREGEPETETYQGITISYWDPVFPEDEPVFPEDEPVLLEEEDIDAAPKQLSEESQPTPVEPTPEPSPEASEADPDVMFPDIQIPEEPGLAIAVLPDFLIAAESPDTIRAWIDARPSNRATSLASEASFQRTLAHPEYDGSLGAFYGKFSEILKYSVNNLEELETLPFEWPFPLEAQQEELEQLGLLDVDSTIDVLIYPQPEGIRIQGRGYFDDALLEAVQPWQPPAPAEVLNHVPAPSYLMFSGQNIAAGWEETVTTLETAEETQEYLDQARLAFRLGTGLDLDEDFFGWMDQGFTVFLFPTRQTPLTTFAPELQIGLGIAIQTSDRAAAENAFAQIEEQLGTSFFTVQSEVVNGQTVSSWLSDVDGDGQEDDSFLGYGWASEDTLVLTTSLGSLSEVLNLGPRQTIVGSPIFQRATEGFPQENQGYFYTNFSSTLSLISSLFPPSEDGSDQEWEDFRKALGTIQTLGTTFSFTEEYLQLDGLVMMSPAR